MKQEVIDKLVEVGLFDTVSITKEEFNKHSEMENNFLYYTTEFEWGTDNIETRYWQTDTKGLTPEEIDLLLKIKQTQDIGTIKKASIFFVTLSVISIVISIIGAVSIANMF